MLWNPGELGAAQAYVTGELEVHDDLADTLARVRSALAERGQRGACGQPRRDRPGCPDRARGGRARPAARAAGLPGAGARPAAQPGPRPHAISFHYDLANEFYAALLDESMAFSCAYWTGSRPGYGLADAQHDKLDLVCGKLGLEPGMTLLDVGCGCGSLALHAARQYGARVVGVTVVAEEKEARRGPDPAAGLADLVEIRLQDYRDVTGDLRRGRLDRDG